MYRLADKLNARVEKSSGTNYYEFTDFIKPVTRVYEWGEVTESPLQDWTWRHKQTGTPHQVYAHYLSTMLSLKHGIIHAWVDVEEVGYNNEGIRSFELGDALKMIAR
jgi:hypothetical protein